MEHWPNGGDKTGNLLLKCVNVIKLNEIVKLTIKGYLS